MATWVLPGYLNEFVMPSPEGWALHITILSWISTDKRLTDSEVYGKIQASELDARIKALSLQDIKKIMVWMEQESLIGKADAQEITYVIPEPEE